ncbi:MAG: hypothetical protein II699_05225 [Lachnospiraceae bacterium]|nr:hypothetical protein [Lachnospiraceae bacterium]
MHYKIWNKRDDIVTPTGNVYSAHLWLNKFPIAQLPNAHMVIEDALINGSIFMEYSGFIKNYPTIDFTGLTPEEGIAAINEWEDTPHPAPEPEPTPYIPSTNERIAASLEALVMLEMEDVVL